ncbi:hypothetical protein [Luteitalea sp.]|uniref:hypothetical protein n=1 Tax=Luteitalea sp. TaxID=2004800 RepID=UPI0025BF38E0|nr:hypothetical protein [Luteitalea sp.]
MFPAEPTAWATLALVERLAAVGLLVASAEQLVRRRALIATGLLSWEVAQLRSRALSRGWQHRMLDPLFRSPGVLMLLGLRAAAAAVVIVMPTPTSAAVVVCAAVTALLMLRSSYGNDGADQMGLIVLVAAALAHAFDGTRVVSAVLWFCAAQACLSYVTSGLAKLRGRRWRDGSGLTGVLSTRTYGVGALHRVLVRRRWLAIALSWSVILTESLFPLVLVVPDAAVPWFLAGGLAFHLGAAVVMGLNTFVWAFAATYPAIAWCTLVAT